MPNLAYRAKIMTHRRRTKFIHEGQYAAEVEVKLIKSQE